MKYISLLAVVFLASIGSFGCKTIESKTSDADSELNDLSSTNTSSIEGIDIPNAHIVTRDGQNVKIIRSQAPRNDSDYQDLKKFGITDVVIFKNQTKNEVDQEILNLKAIGIQSSRVTHIPFLYKEFPDFETPCRQTLGALKSVLAVKRADGRKLLFHCTMGEDRTGYLAGLIDLLDTNQSVKEVFKSEMCRYGYSSGDPHKPFKVTKLIDRDLTPLFLKMSYLIRYKKLTWTQLDPDKLCRSDPSSEAEFKQDTIYSQTSDYLCK